MNGQFTVFAVTNTPSLHRLSQTGARTKLHYTKVTAEHRPTVPKAINRPRGKCRASLRRSKTRSLSGPKVNLSNIYKHASPNIYFAVLSIKARRGASALARQGVSGEASRPAIFNLHRPHHNADFGASDATGVSSLTQLRGVSGDNLGRRKTQRVRTYLLRSSSGQAAGSPRTCERENNLFLASARSQRRKPYSIIY